MTDNHQKIIHIKYFALLREERGLSTETVTTTARTPRELYAELRQHHAFRLSAEYLKVAVNEAYQTWDVILKDNDTVVFIPPVAGG